MSNTPARDALRDATWSVWNYREEGVAEADRLIDAFAREVTMSHMPALGDTTARGNLLNVFAQYFLTTGRGSREIADRILAQHAHDLGQKIRLKAQMERHASMAEHGTTDHESELRWAAMLDAADLIDLQVTR